MVPGIARPVPDLGVAQLQARFPQSPQAMTPDPATAAIVAEVQKALTDLGASPVLIHRAETMAPRAIGRLIEERHKKTIVAVETARKAVNPKTTAKQLGLERARPKREVAARP